MPRVLGVDACKSGWFAVALDPVRAYVGTEIADVVAQASEDGEVAVVGIDIPIGLPDRSRRQADVLAKLEIGRLRSSVFITPARAALLAAEHAEASAVNRKLVGEGMSMQMFRLKEKLLQVDAWVHGAAQRVVEVHPEVSFAALAGSPLTAGKKTWEGAELRRSLLESAGISLRDLGKPGRHAAVDDVLDAAAVAWSARRVLAGAARSLPDPPELFSDGLPAAIWT